MNDTNVKQLSRVSTCARELFRVQSGDEILKLFERSHRVVSDLQKATDAGKGSVIVLRQFTLCLPEDEFRCFVHQGKLTGISQYCYSLLFPTVVKNKAHIEELIRELFQSFPFPFESFVCDVVIVGNERAEIIEINPWIADTGALLFSWKDERDRAVLGGKLPFEFRIREEMHDNPYSTIPYEFREFFERERGIVDKNKKKRDKKKADTKG